MTMPLLFLCAVADVNEASEKTNLAFADMTKQLPGTPG
jgi:hypothetical protein